MIRISVCLFCTQLGTFPQTTIAVGFFKDNHGLAFPLVIDKVFELDKEKLCTICEDIVETFVKANPNALNEYCRYMAVIALADALLCAALSNDKSRGCW